MINHESEAITIMSKLLDITTVRHKVLADNLANVNTPGFVRSDVDFQAQLTNAIDSDNLSQIKGVQPVIELDKDSPAAPDGNNVTMQKELGGMMQNQLLYNFASRVVDRKFNSLKAAIKGGA